MSAHTVVTPAPYVVHNLSNVRAVVVETANGVQTVNAPRSAYYMLDGRMTVRGQVPTETVRGSKGAYSILHYIY